MNEVITRLPVLRLKKLMQKGLIQVDSKMSAKELLLKDGSIFIYNAYMRLLGRFPDPMGFEHYLNCLESGIKSKKRILLEMRLGQEGRKRWPKVDGMWRLLLV